MWRLGTESGKVIDRGRQDELTMIRIRLELDHDRPGPERRRYSFMIKRSLRQVQGAGRWQESLER